MNSYLLPRLAITMGDPGGIGPEIIVKALQWTDVQATCKAVIVGDITVMQKTAQALQSTIQFQPLESQDHRLEWTDRGIFPVYTPPGTSADFVTGEVAAVNGRASHDYIVAAAEGAITGQVDGICTAPIAKEALFAAGFTVPGHTELLASLCGSETVRMMLVGGGLCVVLQTIHVPLSQVPGLLTSESILTSLQVIQPFAQLIRRPQPRIAVCGLNPHAGEAGHFGDEEIRIIIPAINEARSSGMQVSGPYPADTIFHRVLKGEFDFVLAMYHDQGLIPVKTLDFHGGVNVTLGLPIVRTSPDHGTAFDIAGRGIAEESSMVAAIKYAASVARDRITDPAQQQPYHRPRGGL